MAGVVASIARFLTAIDAYWVAAALALLFFALQRRPGMLNTLLTAAVFWLLLRGFGAALRLLVPCIAPNTESAYGFVAALALLLLVPLRLWQRGLCLAIVGLMAGTRAASLGCQVPGDLGLALAALALAVGLLWVLGRWSPARRAWQRASLALDNWAARVSRVPLTPPLQAVLAARLQQHLGFTVEDLKPIGAAGVHASTPVVLTGHDREGRPHRYFAKIVSRQNWQATTIYQASRWLQHQGQLLAGPLWPTLKALVEHEHYMLLLFANAGVPVPRPWGVYRLQRRAYALVSDYLPGAQSLREVGHVSAGYVAQAFEALQLMRQADLAHRDIKASNLVVLPGERFALVDLALAASVAGQRRLARDLADLLVTMSMHHDPATVVRIARETVGLRALGQVRRYLRSSEVNTETAKMLPPDLLPQLHGLVVEEVRLAR